MKGPTIKLLEGNIGQHICNLRGGRFYFIFFIDLFNLFIYLFLAVLGLRCCVWAFPSCGEWGLLFVAVCGLLIAVAFLFAEHGL